MHAALRMNNSQERVMLDTTYLRINVVIRQVGPLVLPSSGVFGEGESTAGYTSSPCACPGSVTQGISFSRLIAISLKGRSNRSKVSCPRSK
jgi:hypothetical protein